MDVLICMKIPGTLKQKKQVKFAPENRPALEKEVPDLVSPPFKTGLLLLVFRECTVQSSVHLLENA